MIKKRHWLTAVALFFFAGVLTLLALFGGQEMPQVDMAAVNRIAREVEKQIKLGEFTAVEDVPYEYAVVGADGLLFSSAPGLADNEHDAVKNHYSVVEVGQEGGPAGKVLIATNLYEETMKQRQRLLAGCLAMLFILCAFAAGYLLVLDARVLKPFSDLKAFARRVAMGELDIPLLMDRKNAFGAFTESFDMMREQLKEARQQEARANQSKKELVASLSHDIKTPVTSIKLISELLLVTEKEAGLRDKLLTINQKAEQIDLLISNMLHASLEELGELKVEVKEEESTRLQEMIKNADYYGRVEAEEIPQCLIYMDPLRMEQVLDNIINNSYKYAGTPMRLLCRMEEGYLRLELLDYGKGVPDEEIPKLYQKFYRGSNTQGETKQGSGLGLYISKHLMKQMGGDLQVFNRSDGFSVELLLRLV